MKILMITAGLLFSGISFTNTCYNTSWVSKWDLNTKAQCGSGYYINGVEFYHNAHENLVHQERYRLKCCYSHKASTSSCNDTSFTSKVDLKASKKVPNCTYARSLGFFHSLHQNYTHQESFKLGYCDTQGHLGPKYNTSWASKEPLHAKNYCPNNYFVRGIAFKHPVHKNETHQESFKLYCQSL